MQKKIVLIGICLAAFVFFGCSTLGMFTQEVTKAVAHLKPTEGNDAKGTVFFIREGGNVRVVVDITGLSPGMHGIHIHEFGDCSDTDASSAGPHFNPTNTPHGCPDSKERHLGDLGNIEADRSGRARTDWVEERISLNGGNSILGRSVVVKAKPDDCVTQPGGGAGTRVACGVIGISTIGAE
jgi:Cu-Zn family superoxide dismutase